MLPGVMQTGKNVGMITMDESLRTLYVKGIITARKRSSAPTTRPDEAFFQS
jgi:twitching motility protein PilT